MSNEIDKNQISNFITNKFNSLIDEISNFENTVSDDDEYRQIGKFTYYRYILNKQEGYECGPIYFIEDFIKNITNYICEMFENDIIKKIEELENEINLMRFEHVMVNKKCEISNTDAYDYIPENLWD